MAAFPEQTSKRRREGPIADKTREQILKEVGEGYYDSTINFC
jgi:hypothetical protein